MNTEFSEKSLRWLVCLFVALGTQGWLLGIAFRFYEYDEATLAHSVWLVSLGLRPYLDFFEVHPPFFWWLLEPVYRFMEPRSAAMVLSRAVSGLGCLFFLAGLFANVSVTMPRHRLWIVWGIAVAAFYPPVTDFLIEFRTDPWAYAVLFWSIWRFRTGRKGTFNYAEFGLWSALSTLASLKLFLLPMIIVVVESLYFSSGRMEIIKKWGSFFLGSLVSIVLAVIVLYLKGIDATTAFNYVVVYHLYFNHGSSFGFGLVTALTENYPLFLLTMAGLGSWVCEQRKNSHLRDSYGASLAIFLIFQALLVVPPLKQYYAPWLLLGSYFICHLGIPLERLSPRFRWGVVGLVCLASLYGVGWYLNNLRNSNTTAVEQLRLIDRLNKATLPEDRIAAPPAIHPIFRRDSSYVWFQSLDPEGPGSEMIAQKLEFLRDRFTADVYRRELEIHPPAFVYLGYEPVVKYFTPVQNSVISRFLQENHYRLVRGRYGFFAVRGDRYERFRDLLGRDGYR